MIYPESKFSPLIDGRDNKLDTPTLFVRHRREKRSVAWPAINRARPRDTHLARYYHLTHGDRGAWYTYTACVHVNPKGKWGRNVGDDPADNCSSSSKGYIANIDSANLELCGCCYRERSVSLFRGALTSLLVRGVVAVNRYRTMLDKVRIRRSCEVKSKEDIYTCI